MATATVANSTTASKTTAFYCTFHGLSGVLTKPADRVLFLDPDSGAVVTMTQADAPHLVVLGVVAEAMAQYLADMAAGGYAAIACSRQQEVA
jgi:hypothetical protein